MKAGIFFTGSGPIIILTSYASLTAPNFVEKLAVKGIGKFIVYEAEVEEGEHLCEVGGAVADVDPLARRQEDRAQTGQRQRHRDQQEHRQDSPAEQGATQLMSGDGPCLAAPPRPAAVAHVGTPA